jgi:predicted Fe-Mo cluster-binding NifX family protein
MKIAVTATGPSLDAEVDPRFGRCPYFLFVETADLSFEAVANGNVTLGGGAGIQSAQLMAEKAVEYVLTGNCGPNAYRALEAAGIKVVTGCSGTARQAMEGFQSGAWSAVQQPNVGSHFGIGLGPGAAGEQPPGPGAGMGRGVGGGIGRGMGRGMGGGRGLGWGMGQGPGTAEPSPVPSQEDELSALKQEATEIGKLLKSVEQRIRELEARKEGGD